MVEDNKDKSVIDTVTQTIADAAKAIVEAAAPKPIKAGDQLIVATADPSMPAIIVPAKKRKRAKKATVKKAVAKKPAAKKAAAKKDCRQKVCQEGRKEKQVGQGEQSESTCKKGQGHVAQGCSQGRQNGETCRAGTQGCKEQQGKGSQKGCASLSIYC